ncbi:MAG: TolC family protein [Nitrospirota bacterium]
MIQRHIKIFLTFLCLLLFFTSIIRADDAGGTELNKKTMPLSIDRGKLLVLKKNLDIAIEKIVPQIEAVKVDKERGDFDPLFSSSFKREDSTTPLSSRSSVAAGGRGSVESEVYSLNTGVSGKVPLGTEYSVGFEDIWTENTFNEFQAEYDSFAGIRITQPLLKNFGSDINRFDIHIAQKNEEISVNELKTDVIDIVADFKNAYWDMVLSIENLKVKEESLRLAESLLDMNRKRLKAEVVSPLEVIQAEAGVASRREAVIMAGINVKEKENILKRLISADVYSLRDIDIIPTDKPVVIPVALELEENIKDGIENRPDYRKIKVEIEKNDLEIQYAKNQKFPNIDLEASYGYNGLGDSFNNSLKEMDDNPEWSLGMVVKIPIGNRAARGDLRIAQLDAEKALLNLKNMEQQIIVEIDNAIRKVDMNRQRIEVTKISTKLAEESLRAEELKLKEGLSTSHDVLEFQEDLAEAKSREISAIIDYNKSQVELSRAKGMLLEDEGIRFYDEVSVKSGREAYQ